MKESKHPSSVGAANQRFRRENIFTNSTESGGKQHPPKKERNSKSFQEGIPPQTQTGSDGGFGAPPEGRNESTSPSEMPKKIGEKEKKDFITLVDELNNTPDATFRENGIDVDRRRSIVDNGIAVTLEKDSTEVSIFIPDPPREVAHKPFLGSTVTIFRFWYRTDNGNTVYKEQRLEAPSRSFDYKEREHVFDSSGKTVIGPRGIVGTRPTEQEIQELGYGKAIIERIFQQLELEETLGSRVVTPERYHEAMTTLRSFLP